MELKKNEDTYTQQKNLKSQSWTISGNFDFKDSKLDPNCILICTVKYTIVL